MDNLLFISNISFKIDAFAKSAIFACKKNKMNFQHASNWSEASQKQIRMDESEYGIKIHNVKICRNPFSLSNIYAFKHVKRIIRDEGIQFIHCNTPVGGMIGRFLKRKKNIVIYEAHGFHFYKGAPIKNWLLYYPVEKILARRTDAIITINKDDYYFAKKHLKTRVFYVPGVGIELDKWDSYKNIRQEIGLDDNDFVLLVVGRLERNKNCGIIIDAVRQIESVKLVFCGDGEDRLLLEEKTKELDLEDRILFLGDRSDMSDIYHMADCFVLASYREGLSRSIMEAMACGLPCIVTDIRGNKDLVDNEFLFNPTDKDGLAEKIRIIRGSTKLREQMRDDNLEKIKKFSFDKVVNELSKIYKEVYRG